MQEEKEDVRNTVIAAATAIGSGLNIGNGGLAKNTRVNPDGIVQLEVVEVAAN